MTEAQRQHFRSTPIDQWPPEMLKMWDKDSAIPIKHLRLCSAPLNRAHYHFEIEQ